MSAAVDVKDDDIDNGDLIHMGGDLVDMMSLVSILRKNVDTVKRINLYDNQIKRLKPVEIIRKLTNLKVFNLSSNELETIPRNFESKTMERLDLSCNRLKVAPHLLKMPSLRVLDLSYNHIRDLTPIREAAESGGLQNLAQLDLRHNFIEDPIAVQCLKPLRALKRLRFCSKAEFKARQRAKIHNSIVSRTGYRAAVRVAIPWLTILDETPLRKPEALSQITLRVDGVALRRFYAKENIPTSQPQPDTKIKENVAPITDKFQERLEKISKERDALRDQVLSLEQETNVKREEEEEKKREQEENKQNEEEEEQQQQQLKELQDKIENMKTSHQAEIENIRNSQKLVEQEKKRLKEERDAMFEEVTRLRQESVVDSCNVQALIATIRAESFAQIASQDAFNTIRHTKDISTHNKQLNEKYQIELNNLNKKHQLELEKKQQLYEDEIRNFEKQIEISKTNLNSLQNILNSKDHEQRNVLDRIHALLSEVSPVQQQQQQQDVTKVIDTLHIALRDRQHGYDRKIEDLKRNYEMEKERFENNTINLKERHKQDMIDLQRRFESYVSLRLASDAMRCISLDTSTSSPTEDEKNNPLSCWWNHDIAPLLVARFKRSRVEINESQKDLEEFKKRQSELENERRHLVAEMQKQHEKLLLTEATQNRLSAELQTSKILVSETQSKILSFSKLEANRELVVRQDTDKLRNELRERSTLLLEKSEDLAELKIAFEDCARQEAACREALESVVTKEHRTVSAASKLSKIVSKQKERLVRTIRAESQEAKLAARLANETISLQNQLKSSREICGERDALREETSEMRLELNRTSGFGNKMKTLESEMWDWKTRARHMENEIETHERVISELKSKETELSRAKEELETAQRNLSFSESQRKRAEDATSAQIEICEELEAIVETLRDGDDKKRKMEEEKGDLVRRLAIARDEIQRKDEALTFASDEVERMQRMWHSKEEDMKQVAREERDAVIRAETESMDKHRKRIEVEMQRCKLLELRVAVFDEERQRWRNEVQDRERALGRVREEHEERMNRIRQVL